MNLAQLRAVQPMTPLAPSDPLFTARVGTFLARDQRIRPGLSNPTKDLVIDVRTLRMSEGLGTFGA
jgi:hypothetical protein